jgi:hypothetical protein
MVLLFRCILHGQYRHESLPDLTMLGYQPFAPNKHAHASLATIPSGSYSPCSVVGFTWIGAWGWCCAAG